MPTFDPDHDDNFNEAAARFHKELLDEARAEHDAQYWVLYFCFVLLVFGALVFFDSLGSISGGVLFVGLTTSLISIAKAQGLRYEAFGAVIGACGACVGGLLLLAVCIGIGSNAGIPDWFNRASIISIVGAASFGMGVRILVNESGLEFRGRRAPENPTEVLETYLKTQELKKQRLDAELEKNNARQEQRVKPSSAPANENPPREDPRNVDPPKVDLGKRKMPSSVNQRPEREQERAIDPAEWERNKRVLWDIVAAHVKAPNSNLSAHLIAAAVEDEFGDDALLWLQALEEKLKKDDALSSHLAMTRGAIHSFKRGTFRRVLPKEGRASDDDRRSAREA